MNESETRAEYIDPKLKASGWGEIEGTKIMPNISKQDLELEFKTIFWQLMFGARLEYKEAKKRVNYLWHHTDRQVFQECTPVALMYLSQFDQIKNPENQAAFASGLQFFYLVLADDYFDTLKNFTLQVLQNPHGHVREAMRHTADWLYVSLTARAEPFIYPAGEKLTEKQKIKQVQSRQQYLDLVKELEELMENYLAGDEKAEYINELKPSVHKTLQLFWNRLIDSPVYRRISESFQATPADILVKRRELEREIAAQLKKIGSDFTLDDVQMVIYLEQDNDDYTEILAMFDRGGDVAELSDILELINDAWNYFPHHILDGLSPAEKLRKYQESKKQN